MKGYQGFSNWDTWYACYMVEDYEYAHRLRRTVKHWEETTLKLLIEHVRTRFYSQWDRGFNKENVNWKELAEHWNEEH